MSEVDKSMKDCLKNIPGYLNYLCRGYYVPKDLKDALETDEDVILHLSDTPSSVYRSVLRLIEILKPRVIIHTGDLADDIKLELYPDLSFLYNEKAVPFLLEMEKSAAEEIYIVPGNHDLAGLLEEAADRSRIVPDGTVIEIRDLKVGLAHCQEDLPPAVDYNLYGHNLDCPADGNPCSLNGCSKINIILSPSKRVYQVPYPVGTNQERQYKPLNGRLL